MFRSYVMATASLSLIRNTTLTNSFDEISFIFNDRKFKTNNRLSLVMFETAFSPITEPIIWTSYLYGFIKTKKNGWKFNQPLPSQGLPESLNELTKNVSQEDNNTRFYYSKVIEYSEEKDGIIKSEMKIENGVRSYTEWDKEGNIIKKY